ncbi:MAG: hypothetical protein WC795_00200 [Candidatus Paceibacterota bacterium]|jgi:hypothetical protein
MDPIYFYPKAGAIVIKAYGEKNKIWRSLLFLRAGYSAFVNRYGYTAWTDPDTFIRHQLESNIFQFRLESKMGGQLYSNIVSNSVRRLFSTTSFEGDFKSFSSLVESVPKDSLDYMFGEITCQYTRNRILSNMHINAVFLFFDNFFNKEEAKKQKIDFLITLYFKE